MLVETFYTCSGVGLALELFILKNSREQERPLPISVIAFQSLGHSQSGVDAVSSNSHSVTVGFSRTLRKSDLCRTMYFLVARARVRSNSSAPSAHMRLC